MQNLMVINYKIMNGYWPYFIRRNLKIIKKKTLVPTSDTVRYKFLLKCNIDLNYPTLFCGPTGTGKSIYIY